MAFSVFRGMRRSKVSPTILALATGAGMVLAQHGSTRAQGYDCDGLRQQIAQAGRGGGNGRARRQSAELARTQAAAHRLGCDQGGFLFFGGGGNSPQCPGLNARISQLQASLSQMQAGGGGSREDLLARYNAYCRGGEPPHERGFFESLFGGPEPRQGPPPDAVPEQDPDEGGPHGGGQAVCVRTCDGGFFPMGMSARHSPESLNEMCSALCPGAESTVYTRSPNADIKSAVGLDGKPYSELPNALKFQKQYSSACTCKPADKSWAEALVNAEEISGNQRKGDILVTQEKSDELSRPKMDPKARAALLAAPGTTKVSPETAGKLAADPPALRTTPDDATGPDGAKQTIRRVGPQD